MVARFNVSTNWTNKADVVFAAHELMFVTLNTGSARTFMFGLVIIDEGFSLKGASCKTRAPKPRTESMKLLDDDRPLGAARQSRAISTEDANNCATSAKLLGYRDADA